MTDQEVNSLAEDMQTVFAVLGYGLVDLLKESHPLEYENILVANVKRRSLDHLSTETLVPFYIAFGNLLQQLEGRETNPFLQMP